MCKTKNAGIRLLRMFLAPVSRFSVLLAGIYSFMWGLWVAYPGTETFAASPIYDLLHYSGSELLWGGVQMVVGIALIAASFDSVKYIKWATFLGFLSWTVIALAFAIASPANAGMWVTGYLATTNAYFFLNFTKRDEMGA